MLTSKLDQLIDEMDEIVYTHLSGMLRILKFEHPMFFAEFMEARNIIDLKGKRRVSGTDVSVDESPPQEYGNACLLADRESIVLRRVCAVFNGKANKSRHWLFF